MACPSKFLEWVPSLHCILPHGWVERILNCSPLHCLEHFGEKCLQAALRGSLVSSSFSCSSDSQFKMSDWSFIICSISSCVAHSCFWDTLLFYMSMSSFSGCEILHDLSSIAAVSEAFIILRNISSWVLFFCIPIWENLSPSVEDAPKDKLSSVRHKSTRQQLSCVHHFWCKIDIFKRINPYYISLKATT